GDDLLQALAIPRRRYAGEIRADPITFADRVARGTVIVERVLASVEGHRRRVRERDAGLFRGLPAVQPVADRAREELRIVGRRIPHPLPGGLVADEQARGVAVRIVRIRLRVQPSLPADQVDVFGFAGEEEPARTDI